MGPPPKARCTGCGPQSPPPPSDARSPVTPRPGAHQLDAPAKHVGLACLLRGHLAALGRCEHVQHSHAAVQLAVGHVVVQHLRQGTRVRVVWVGMPGAAAARVLGAAPTLPLALPPSPSQARCCSWRVIRPGRTNSGSQHHKPLTLRSQSLEESGCPSSRASSTNSSRSSSKTFRNSCDEPRRGEESAHSHPNPRGNTFQSMPTPHFACGRSTDLLGLVGLGLLPGGGHRGFSLNRRHAVLDGVHAQNKCARLWMGQESQTGCACQG